MAAGYEIETTACNAFWMEFDVIYGALYESDVAGELVDYRKAVEKYDVLAMNDNGFRESVKGFVSLRGDLIASDMECAAFVLAMEANGLV